MSANALGVSRILQAIGRPAATAVESSADSVRCPRECGARLTFRSNPFKYGRTEQRCDRCGTPWTVVAPTVEVPRYVHPDQLDEDGERPTPAPARPTAGMTPAQQRAHAASMARRVAQHARRVDVAKARILKVLSRDPAQGVAVRALQIRLELSRPMVDRAIASLVAEGVIASRRATRVEVSGRGGMGGGQYPFLFWRVGA